MCVRDFLFSTTHFRVHIHIHTHTHTRTHTLNHTLALSPTLFHAHTSKIYVCNDLRSDLHSRSYAHLHTRSHIHTRTHTLTHTRTLSHSLSHTHIQGLLAQRAEISVADCNTHCNTLQHTATHCNTQHTLYNTHTFRGYLRDVLR